MIKSVEDADKYLEQIRTNLTSNSKLAKETGLYSHAAMFHTMLGAFYNSPEAIDRLTGTLQAFNELEMAISFKGE